MLPMALLLDKRIPIHRCVAPSLGIVLVSTTLSWRCLLAEGRREQQYVAR
jgi:hypothetical protein